MNKKSMRIREAGWALILATMAVPDVCAEYPRMVVCEEITGTWCKYCPSGIVALEEVSKAYPGQFLPISVHYNDVMAVDGYVGRLLEQIGNVGSPYAYTMRSRKYSGAVADLDGRVEYLTFTQASGMIFIEADIKGDVVEVSGIVRTDIPLEDGKWGIELILTEDGVCHPDDPAYNQRNAYSGSETPMGGFENLPDPVMSKDMLYNDVARMAYAVPESLLPGAVAANQDQAFSCLLELPPSVDDISKCNVTALLLDAGGVVTNAWRCRPGESQSGRVETGVPDERPETFDLLGRKVSERYRGFRIEKLSNSRGYRIVK